MITSLVVIGAVTVGFVVGWWVRGLVYNFRIKKKIK